MVVAAGLFYFFSVRIGSSFGNGVRLRREVTHHKEISMQNPNLPAPAWCLLYFPVCYFNRDSIRDIRDIRRYPPTSETDTRYPLTSGHIRLDPVVSGEIRGDPIISSVIREHPCGSGDIRSNFALSRR